MIGGVKVLDPKETKGIVYLIPVPKSPHGVDVDPSGQYICAAESSRPKSPCIRSRR